MPVVGSLTRQRVARSASELGSNSAAIAANIAGARAYSPNFGTRTTRLRVVRVPKFRQAMNSRVSIPVAP